MISLQCTFVNHAQRLPYATAPESEMEYTRGVVIAVRRKASDTSVRLLNVLLTRMNLCLSHGASRMSSKPRLFVK